MKRMGTILAVIGMVLGMSHLAGATALYVLDDDPWSIQSVQQEMADLKIDYVEMAYGDVVWGDLATYDFILLSATNGNTAEYNAHAVPHMAQLETYVRSGGLAVIHCAPFVGEMPAPDMAPGGVDFVFYPTQNLDIAPGYSGPLANGVTDDSLDDGSFSSHGYFVDTVPGTRSVFVYEGEGEPAYIQYAMGMGEVWVTGMPLEWHWNIPLYPNVLRNELEAAEAFVPTPLPATLLLLGTGIIGLVGLRRTAGKQ